MSARLFCKQQEEEKILKECKKQDPVNLNTEMTLRKKLNAARNQTDGVDKTKKNKKGSSGQKKIPPKKKKIDGKTNPKKKKDKLQKASTKKKEEGSEENDESQQDQEEEEGKEGKQNEENTTTAAAAASSSSKGGAGEGGKKKFGQFSLEAAQKQSKSTKKTKKPQERIPADGSWKKKKKHEERKGNEQQAATIPVIASPKNMVLEGKERTHARNRCTSQAYHKEFDKHKPKKAMLQENPKQYQNMMEKAKAKARAAHKEAGTRFDAEHPRAAKEEKKSNEKNTPDGGRDAEGEEQANEEDDIPDVS